MSSSSAFIHTRKQWNTMHFMFIFILFVYKAKEKQIPVGSSSPAASSTQFLKLQNYVRMQRESLLLFVANKMNNFLLNLPICAPQKNVLNERMTEPQKDAPHLIRFAEHETDFVCCFFLFFYQFTFHAVVKAKQTPTVKRSSLQINQNFVCVCVFL